MFAKYVSSLEKGLHKMLAGDFATSNYHFISLSKCALVHVAYNLRLNL